MTMSLFSIFNVAASGMAAQSQRLNTVASNIANAESATGPDGQAYRAKQVVFAAQAVDHSGSTGVAVTHVVDDPNPPRMMYDPKHPLANEQGYVAMPNVNPVEEMVNMISASRAYQNNVETLNAAKTLLQKTLTIGQ